jgi:hypothetical protein
MNSAADLSPRGVGAKKKVDETESSIGQERGGSSKIIL